MSVAEAKPLDPWDQDMDNWDRLNKAVGGDLWSNPAKTAIMREIDAQMPADGPWEDFQAAVVQAIQDCGSQPGFEIT